MSNQDKQIRKEYGEMIRKWRLDRNLGLREFCNIINLSPRILSKIENPDIKLDYRIIRGVSKDFYHKEGKKDG